MVISKSFGNWCDNFQFYPGIETSYLDDLAYFLYCSQRRNRKEINIAPQIAFFTHPKVYKAFYNKAKVIIRKEKIERICQK